MSRSATSAGDTTTILAGARATADLAQQLGVAHAGGDPLAEAQALAEHPPAPAR